MDAENTKEVEKMALIMFQGEFDADEGKLDTPDFSSEQIRRYGLQRLVDATALINAGYVNINEAIQCVLIHAAKAMNAARWSAEDNGKAVRLLELVAKVYGVELYESDDEHGEVKK